jgi:hypothetical protein
MPLSQPILPFIPPDWDVPFDVATAFANGQVIAATGFVNAIQQQVDIGAGRWIGKWNIDLSVLKLSALDESYRFFLLGSNNPLFAATDVEVLATQDFAAVAAGRLFPTLQPGSNVVPTAGRSSSRFTIPVTNQRGIFTFRYLQMQAVLAGTAPTCTVASWLAGDMSC